MQAVAAELSLSETCFLHPLPQKRWSLRWFTPIHEVALCGHATLAASHLLWEEGYLAEIDQACFETRSGQLVASRRGEEIELDFPIVPVAAAQEPLRLKQIRAVLHTAWSDRPSMRLSARLTISSSCRTKAMCEPWKSI